MNVFKAGISEYFAKLGLSPQEAKAYLYLLEKGGVTGYQLSKTAGIPSSKIYNILTKLQNRGYVVAGDTKPVRYFPCSPAEVLERCRKEFERSLVTLEEALQEFQNNRKQKELLAWNITSRPDVMRKAKEIIGWSQKRILLAVWPEDLRILRQGLSAAAERDVDIHLVSYGKTKFDQGVKYPHRPSDYIFREAGLRRFVLTADDQWASIANFDDQGRGGGLWTENPGLVFLFRDFIIHEIYIVKVEEAFPDQIHRAFGENWEKLRQQLWSTESELEQ